MKCSIALFLLCFSTLNQARNMPDDNGLPIDFIELLGDLDGDSTAFDFAMTQLASENKNSQAINPQQFVTQKPSFQKSSIRKSSTQKSSIQEYSIQKSTTMPSKKSPTGGEKQ